MGVDDTVTHVAAPADVPKAVLTEYVNGAVVTPVEGAPLQATEGEAAPEAAKPAVKAEDKMFGAKFAALSRKEKEQRAAAKSFEAQKAAWEKQKADQEAQWAQKEKELSSKYINPEDFKKEPLELIKKHGMSFEQLAQRVLNDGKPGAEEVISDTEKKLQARLDAMEKALAEKDEAAKKREEEDRQRKFEETLTGFKAQLTDFCNKEADYEMIRANDAVGLVFEVIEEHHKNTMNPEGVGLILSNKEAADAVENYLLEEAKKQMNVSKVKALAAKVVEAKPTEGKSSSPTLSNAQSAHSAPSKGQKLLSDDESRKEAAKLIKWQD